MVHPSRVVLPTVTHYHGNSCSGMSLVTLQHPKDTEAKSMGVKMNPKRKEGVKERKIRLKHENDDRSLTQFWEREKGEFRDCSCIMCKHKAGWGTARATREQWTSSGAAHCTQDNMSNWRLWWILIESLLSHNATADLSVRSRSRVSQTA